MLGLDLRRDSSFFEFENICFPIDGYYIDFLRLLAYLHLFKINRNLINPRVAFV